MVEKDGEKRSDVLILLGSESDRKVAEKAQEVLDKLGIGYIVEVASAHRNPEKVRKIVEESREKIIIAIAGLAAHLPGFVAAHTIKPVIGVPVSGTLMGIDSLLSIVQMPKGIPVACVGIDRGDNAAILAAQMIAVENSEIREKLISLREELKK
jgi:5-(carboxyamino)imidazole ribonucleotide mutase